MPRHIRPAIVLLAALTAITGVAYPLAVAGVAEVAFPAQANGSLILRGGKIVGSSLIGQNFASPRYFHGRPSATSAPDPADSSKTIDAPYNAANSSGANLGPTSQKLIDRVRGDAEAWRATAGPGSIPADAVTTSASGLDPDITPQNAGAQAAAIARARGLTEERLRALIAAQTERPLFGILGEPRVNVLGINLALDQLGSD
ncbi:MAG: potassium-transporting ATPase subunit KdpC [Hyphomicrobiales bacterium]|nr:potassium-transporting ATPase subunit KdpC [Hyphomicrobiales bacterium]